MNVAIVGSGFGGLALAWYLLQKEIRVTLFDANEIGCSAASPIAAGLMHPYPGEQARRSWKAAEALSATLELLKLSQEAQGEAVANFSGIMRYALGESQRAHLIERTKEFDDIDRVGEDIFFIRSGVTVYSRLYLEGLKKACLAKGAFFESAFISSLDDLPSYDRTVLACGSGLFHFPETHFLKLKQVKGQVLKCTLPLGLLEMSRVGKGYIALGERPDICYAGATFERAFSDELPDQAMAKKDIFSKIELFFPEVSQLKIIECRAAIRVTREGSYLPFIAPINNKTWGFGAFGSRGLLYHAFFAKQLSELILKSFA